MAEDDKLHDIHAILRRPVKVLEGEFNNAFTTVSLKFPDVIFQNSANVVKKLDYFTFFRANVKIRLVFNATPFMSGKYWLFFAPFDDVSNRGAMLNNLPNATGFPGVEIDVGSNAPVEIKMPYCSPLSHFNLIDSHSNMGEMYIVPINPIQSGTSPLTVGANFTIFAWFEDIELAMPTSKAVTVPAVADEVWVAQIGSEEHAATSGPPISGIANTVAAAASVLGSVPILGSWMRPVEWVSRAVGGAASAVGWNKPTNLDKNCPYINVPAKGFTNVDGIDLSSKLGAMPDNGLTYDGGIFSTDVDEMDLTYVSSKSCIFRSAIPWNLSTAVGTNLHYNAVAPGLTQGSTILSPTTVAYVASMFQQWRGTIKYRLAAAKTAFHTGRLRITYHPGVYGSDALTGTIAENAYNWILDLSVSSELEFEVPYVSNVPWKEVFLGPYNHSSWDLERYSTGTITITVLNELRRASDSVADNVPLNMWISGGEDISYAMPDFARFTVAQPLTALGDLQEEPETEWRAQVFNLTSTAIEHNEQVQDTSTSVFPMSMMDHTMAEQLCIGEKITSLRQLIKRFGLTSIGKPFPYINSTGERYCFPGPIPLNNDSYLFNKIRIDPAYFGETTTTGSVQWQNIRYPVSRAANGTLTEDNFEAVVQLPTRCPLYYISYLYRFWRGSRRYKFATPATNGLRSTNQGRRPAFFDTTTRDEYDATFDGFEYDAIRPTDPLIVRRSTNIDENGALERPVLDTFTGTQNSSVFEHYVYPDLNGTIEFEVPYYAQTPISLVGEGTISSVDGPIVRRSKVDVMRSLDPKGLDRPMYSYYNNTTFPQSPISTAVDTGGVRNCFGAYNLYEAAGDDFSFGYLIGAPRIRRVAHI
nr:hypothetical protein 2 [Beihai picorna-like virus 70]